MSKYSVGEREAAAWNVQLDLQWGKTGLIMLYFVHWWAASSQLLPAQVCKKITVQEACIRREGRSCCIK